MDRKSKEIYKKAANAKNKKDLEKIKKVEHQAKQKKMVTNYNWLIITSLSVLCVALVIVAVFAFMSKGKGGTTTTTNEPPKIQKAVVETSQGSFTIELDEANAKPIVDNFKANMEKLIYNGSYFNRIVKGAYLRGGVPMGTNRQGFGANDTINFFKNDLKHVKWAVSVPAQGTGLNKTQFQIMLSDQTTLDKKDCVFGKVIEGADVLEKLASVRLVKQDKNDFGIDPNDVSKAQKEDDVRIVRITLKQ